MDHIPRIRAHFADSAQLKIDAVDALAPQLARAADVLATCLLSDGKILACGNGGSAADAQHFAAEMIGRFERERPELPAISLVTDTSILSAVANDYSFEQVFAKQVRGLGAKGDALIALSTSGNSGILPDSHKKTVTSEQRGAGRRPHSGRPSGDAAAARDARRGTGARQRRPRRTGDC